MIKMTLLTGPYAGITRDVSEVDPKVLFHSVCVEHNWEWKIDYSQATEEESQLWGGQDLAIRSIRALQNGRSVYFLDKKYHGFSEEIVGELEDALVDSGRLFWLESDDENGVVIKAGHYESH